MSLINGDLKENLIVMDSDFIRDYGPENGVPLQLPEGFALLTAQGFSPEQMPTILQRAKIILDLGMPVCFRIVSSLSAL